ncbi:MAG: (Na+)-NQR maturation NqrM [Porticoccaceae bacterium]|nr:(Na+)-NQR maturation NqrM [Porticoccaceae bacterium]
MLTFFITLAVLLTIIAAMSVGVLMGRKPISGSCGGVGAALGEEEYVCDICGGDPNKCEENGGDNDAAKNLGYNAAGR